VKKVLIATALMANFSFGASGNQASIADIKEAVYKLIIFNEKYRVPRPKVVYKPLTTKKSYLDKYIKSYVQKNKKYLPSR